MVKYTCNYCNKNFYKKAYYKTHMRKEKIRISKIQLNKYKLSNEILDNIISYSNNNITSLFKLTNKYFNKQYYLIENEHLLFLNNFFVNDEEYVEEYIDIGSISVFNTCEIKIDCPICYAKNKKRNKFLYFFVEWDGSQYNESYYPDIPSINLNCKIFIKCNKCNFTYKKKDGKCYFYWKDKWSFYWKDKWLLYEYYDYIYNKVY